MKILALCLLFFVDFYASKTSLADSKVKSKISECQRCKVLSDSIKYWLDKTSRGKYEGGDAAWEESKLKSYSRSEVRLVEVQEGLCSELNKHQDYCYSLAEDAESLIEKWWYLDNPQSVDLYTWLCIDNLHYCCPKNHYGESCSPCPHINNKLCGGHGHCNGDGTRKGNGTCHCHKGYTGKHCELCDSNYYSMDSICKPCHKACSECTGEGDGACKQCKDGWEMVNGVCTDINECLAPSVCRAIQYCVNTEGSYDCRTCDASCKTCVGEGKFNCTSCDNAEALWNGICVNGRIKYDILYQTVTRCCKYSSLFTIAYFLHRYSKSLAPLAVSALAVYLYFTEKAYNMTVIEVAKNFFFN
ncbi:cysteine-rich with EGF-like domain protein 2 [Ostrinia furnacalis]|uniref:cysteine-rich with EGF-like domain protein 2 n=1 Tax=Ostrinia furnacalis TaxID=93504 RepID=UPI00103E81B4|nr:cysteine-rich with EGF-like domain protein 2 [Ostrinia furnacalis]